MNTIISKNQYGSINAGSGYSTDSQQVTSQVCYNATVSSLTGTGGSASLNVAKTFMELQEDIKMSVDVKGGIGMFSADARASYLQSIEEKEYSLSFNYYTFSYTTASVQVSGTGIDMLTDNAKLIYNNSFDYFGLICGDNVITSYDEGAMLLMSINIDFSSKYQKREFESHVGGSLGNILSVSGEVSQVVSQFGITGSVAIQATQGGGDPSQISHILNKNGNGDYYALTCSLDAMSDCVSAANSMLNYANNDYPTQFSFKNNTGLSPLGPGFMSYHPTYYYALTPPPSLVTKQVLEDRDSLADAFQENQYYEQNFYGLINGYPVAWDTTSSVYKEIQSLYQRTQNNIETILSPGSLNTGALGCYDFPDQCNTIAQNILSNLVPITANDLTFLKQVQYSLPVTLGVLFFAGSGYGVVPGYNPPQGDSFHDFGSLTLTDTTYDSVLHWCGHGDCSNRPSTTCFTTSSTDGITYTGISYDKDGYGWVETCSVLPKQVAFSKVLSPFYFEAYNSTSDESDLVGISYHGESIN